jgi:hypothetical protein
MGGWPLDGGTGGGELLVRLKDRSGVAVLFDALMFLTVMTLVSVSMLTLLGHEQDGADRQRYVDSVHNTILASTVSFQEGPPCTLADLVGSFLRLGDDVLEKRIEDEVRSLLDGYFGPGIEFLWSMESGEVHSSFGSDMYRDAGGGDVHVSQLRWQENGTAMLCGLKVRYP